MSFNDNHTVPSRWFNCPRKSLGLIADRFLAFKTPLSDEYDDVVPPHERFPPRMLFEACKTNKIQLGLWVDLTNTRRFYEQAQIEQEGCEYVKIACKGHSQTPTVKQTREFIEIIAKFICYNPLKMVAVHCTHGFNRTGFLIISYMVEQLDYSLEKALADFAQFRPPGIYKENYICELYRRYDSDEEPPPPPTRPDWCFEDDNVSNGSNRLLEEDVEAAEEHTETSSSPRKRMKQDSKSFKRLPVNPNAKFMFDIAHIKLFTKQPDVYHIRDIVRHMCNWERTSFPGCQPVSMDRNNIKLLLTCPYRVSWKADGVRYMMLIKGRDAVYFIDRDFNVFVVDGLTFPTSRNSQIHLSDTLLDGEMVIDIVEGQRIPRYLVYDIVQCCTDSIGAKPFYPDRLAYIDTEVIWPRYQAMEKGQIQRQKEPFSVRKKDFWDVTQAVNLLGEKFARRLCHQPDGLVFQPSRMPYKAGQCHEVLKWKPSTMNSIDFRLEVRRNDGVGKIGNVCYLYTCDKIRHMAEMKYSKSLKVYHKKIVECTFNNGQWEILRERKDKKLANSFETAKAVYNSIIYPVHKEDLLKLIEDQHRASQAMPPPAKPIKT